jgi:hypothetical protein
LIWKPNSDIESTSAHTIAQTSKKICDKEIKVLHYKHIGVDALVKRSDLIKARVPADSYCKGIKGNILKIYPGFVKTRKEWVHEINNRMRLSYNVI